MEIAVTGIGIVTPFGIGIEKNWDALVQGKHSYKSHQIDDTRYTVGLCPDLELKEEHFPKFKQDKLAKVTKLSFKAAEEALIDSNLLGNYDSDMVSVFIGVTNEAVSEIARLSWDAGFKGKRINPNWFPNNMSNAPGSYITEKFNLKGANYAVNSACASSAHAILNGVQSLETGRSDAVIVGGSEGSCTGALQKGFAAIRAASKSGEVKPFDSKRDGLVLGEGSCILVLERLDDALKRNAPIHAILAGIGASSNAGHITNPCAKGTALAMRKAIKDANMDIKDVDYINAHGTATKLGDIAEVEAIKDVFGDKAYDLSISSTKGSTGHCLAAGGAIEVFASIEALKRGIIPQTANLKDQDPDFDLDFTPNKSISKDIEVALSNSLGFGGTNCSIVLKKYKI